MPEIVISITPAGTASVDAKGFKGGTCDKATEQIELVLGGHAKRTKKRKPDFYTPAGNNVRDKLTF